MDHKLNPGARLLDVTRLSRRAGRLPTGIDRVELAYLEALLDADAPLFGLARTRLGYVLLDRAGLEAFQGRVRGNHPWGEPDRLSRVIRGLSEDQRRAESDLRRLAMARCLPQRLGKMLMGHLPPGTSYLNVGHSNLTHRVLFVLKYQVRARISVMIHDTIPLDFPQYQRPETLPAFRGMLKRVRETADLVICNSAQTQRDVERHMSAWGPVPQTVVAFLGVEVSRPVPARLPAGFDAAAPYFVTVGTIEPRKNHALLLDLWEEMAEEGSCPQLLICGHRGWSNAAVFERLDHDPLMGRLVFECPGMSDGEITSLLLGSCGLLFPSFAEGYGLPPLEAAMLGVPVICNDLPVYREQLGDIPVYAGIEDRYLWKHKIMGAMQPRKADRQDVVAPGLSPPTWKQHFNVVLSLT